MYTSSSTVVYKSDTDTYIIRKNPINGEYRQFFFFKTRARKHKTCSLLRSPEDYRQVEMLYAKKGCIYLSYD